MSSDTYTIHVTKIAGDQAEFHCYTGTAGGYNDLSYTRSFALMIIEDGMPYFSEAKGTPLQKEMRRLSGQETPRVWEAEFHKKYLKNFIVSSKLVKRIGIITDISAWRHGRFELNNEDEYPLHQFIVEVQVTDPKWLEGLKEGSRYGTTAFDAWWEDPKRQSERAIAAVTRAATLWTPPGAAPVESPKASPAKRGAQAVKKAAVKKAAVKKAAVKKKSSD